MDKSKPLKTNDRLKVSGGTWYASPGGLRAAFRPGIGYGAGYDYRLGDLGFRVVRCPKKEQVICKIIS